MTIARTLVLGAGTLVAALSAVAAAGATRQQAPAPEVTVYKSPT